MTGVAAQMCGDKNVITELGYQVKPDGAILQEETDEDGKKTWVMLKVFNLSSGI